MSEYGHVNDDTATVLRLFAARNDDRTRIGANRVTVARKATRLRASSVKRSIDSTIVHPVKDAWSVERTALSYGEVVSTNTKQRSFAAGGQVRLSDMHKNW